MRPLTLRGPKVGAQVVRIWAYMCAPRDASPGTLVSPSLQAELSRLCNNIRTNQLEEGELFVDSQRFCER